MRRHTIPDLEMRTKLSERDLECHLLVPKDPCELCDELKPLLQSAYSRVCTPSHFKYETWAVTLRSRPTEEQPEPPPVACLALGFYDSMPSYFLTHFEAVEPSMQRTGLGRLLFDCAAIWCRFLLLNDPLVTQGVLNSAGTYHLVSYIDLPDEEEDMWESSASDNEHGHGQFLKKLGFVRAQHDFGQDIEIELAFSREFHVPVSDYLEAEILAQPARPASA